VLRGGTNDALLSWRNSTNTGNVSIFKDSADRINFEGGIKVEGGITPTGSGMKHGTVTINQCPSAGCSKTLTWEGVPFSDSNYTVICDVQDSTRQSEGAGLRLAKLSEVGPKSVRVDIDNLSATTASGVLHCVALQK
jgi:hypothetical protein